MSDFGLARIATSTMGTATRNCGTPGYQSPEQLKGTVKVPALCDVYAMGCVLIEVFGGNPLWEPGKSAWEIMYKVTVENSLPSFDHKLYLAT